MKSLIITDNQDFHHVSPKFSNSPDDSPDQELNRIKIEYHLVLVPGAPPGACMTVTNRPNRSEKRKKIVKIFEQKGGHGAAMPRKKGEGDGGSAAQKRAHGALPDAVRATKKSSTPVACYAQCVYSFVRLYDRG